MAARKEGELMLLQEQLTTIEVIPYKTFKEKIRITKELKNCKIEIHKDYILTEKVKECH